VGTSYAAVRWVQTNVPKAMTYKDMLIMYRLGVEWSGLVVQSVTE